MLKRPYDMRFFASESDEGGIQFEHFQTALQVWSFMQNDLQTVRQCADTFGVTDEVIREAVAGHPWMLLTGPDDDPTKQLVEHDGD